MSVSNYSVSGSEASETGENTYCIFLHIVKGIGFNTNDTARGGGGDIGDSRKNCILLKATLNGVQFEVEGRSITHDSATIFNSNCIWECELGDLKRMKTDNRPVKLECFLKSARSKNAPSKIIGSLLLPIRGVKTINNLTKSQLKIFWHKLGTLSSEWRQNRPEIYLMLLIVKKSVIENGQLEALLTRHKPPSTAASNSEIMLSPNISETAYMLQSQRNVYVQQLEQLGQIQVGNNPDVDCNLFTVTLIFKEIKNIMELLNLSHSNQQSQEHCFVFQYDFLGSNSEIPINPHDCNTINEKITLNFRSSLKSLRLYFQKIFYIPITLLYNDIAIANYQFNFSKLLPADDMYFNSLTKLWTQYGTFGFDWLRQAISPRDLKPSVDFIFSIQLQISHAKENNLEIVPFNETFSPYEVEPVYPNMDMTQVVPTFNRLPFDKGLTDKQMEIYDKIYEKDVQVRHPERISDYVPTRIPDHAIFPNAHSINEFSKDDVTEKYDLRENVKFAVEKETNTMCVGTDDDPLKTFSSIAINTEPCDITDHEELTMKIVQELEEWKSQQMEHFLNDLKRKQESYMKDVQSQWEQQRAIIQARLEAKMAKCEELNAQLEKAQVELNATAMKNRETINITETIKRDIETNYSKKFFELESEMQRLKLDLKQRSTNLEIKNKQIQIDKTSLEMENVELKERVEQLEKQLTMWQNSQLSADQFKDVLNDLRKQNERIVVLEKSRNSFKEKWSLATQEVNKLKVKNLNMQKEAFERKSSKNNGFEFNLEEILNEEQEILKSDRSELKSIKLSLFSSSDSSDEPT